MSKFNYQLIEEKISFLISKSKDFFSEDEVFEVVDFMNHGEYGIALETYIDICIEEKKFISNEIINELEIISGLIGVDVCKKLEKIK